MKPVTFTLPKTVSEAHAMQEVLRGKLRLSNDFTRMETVAGVDVGYDVERGLAHASLVRMGIGGSQIMEQVQALVPVDFPYIPGLLAFREIPAVLAALGMLKEIPDLLMVDGQGIAHPRRMGIAAHLGLLLDMPAIGVAKSRLCGSYKEPGEMKGSTSPLMHRGEQIGVVLRSKDKVKPLFVSPGHRVDMNTALELALRCLGKYKLPEPTRLADKYSKMKECVVVANGSPPSRG